MICLLTILTLTVSAAAQEPGWSLGTATYYTGIDDLSGGYSGNCGFKDLSRNLAQLENASYGAYFAAGSSRLYSEGAGCGSCYDLKCIGSPICKEGSIVVTITDFCPFKGNEQWCGSDKYHFDLSGKAFSSLVSTMAAGHVALQWRRTSCKRNGPPVVSIEGNKFWQSVHVMNLPGTGTYDTLLVRGAAGDSYTPLRRDWGSIFVHDGQIQGPLSVKLINSDPKGELELLNCIPEGWTTGNEYACKGRATAGVVSTRRLTMQDTKERLKCDCTCTVP